MDAIAAAHPELRVRHQERAATLKHKLAAAGLPVMASATHIVPLFVGDDYWLTNPYVKGLIYPPFVIPRLKYASIGR